MVDDPLRDLYRDVVLERQRSPKLRGRLASPTLVHAGANPLCGDEVEISLRLDGERLTDIAFQGEGCAISQAAASLMAEAVVGRPLVEVAGLVDAYRRMLVGDEEPAEALGDAAALRHVRRFPARVKCALLAWKTLEEAIALYGKRATV